MPLVATLTDPARPVFLFGSTPPREGTPIHKAKEACAKFAARSAVLATDGFIVYDIQDEGARATSDRPFPFRKTMDPSLYASFFPTASGKECVVYKCVVENGPAELLEWLERAVQDYGHGAFNLVGPASSSQGEQNLSLSSAAALVKARRDCKFGCVAIAERHTVKGNEHQNLMRKVNFGAEWFITQGIFDAGPMVKLLNDYGDLCREQGKVPKKVVLTFAPCGRAKTMTFIKWLGMHVPEDVEKRILTAQNPVQESIEILCEILTVVLEQTRNSGIPLGINVESLSIFKEEIDAAHELFQRLQALMLHSYGSPWAVRWFFVDRPLRRNVPSSREHLLLSYIQDAQQNSEQQRVPSPPPPPVVKEAEGVQSPVRTVTLTLPPVPRNTYMGNPLVLVAATAAVLVTGYFLGRSSKKV